MKTAFFVMVQVTTPIQSTSLTYRYMSPSIGVSGVDFPTGLIVTASICELSLSEASNDQ